MVRSKTPQGAKSARKILQKINNENDTDSDDSSCSPSKCPTKPSSTTTANPTTEDAHEDSSTKTTQHFVTTNTEIRHNLFTPLSAQDDNREGSKFQEFFMKQTEEGSEYFYRCFCQIVQELNNTKSCISGLLESFFRKQDRTTREHRNEICNHVEKVANLESELKIARTSIESHRENVKAMKSLHSSQLKETRSNKKESESDLKRQIAELENRVQALSSSDHSLLENQLTLATNKLQQAEKYFKLSLNTKESMIEDLRKEILVKTKTITKQEDELVRSMRDFRTYKRVTDKEGQIADTRIMMSEKKREAERMACEREMKKKDNEKKKMQDELGKAAFSRDKTYQKQAVGIVNNFRNHQFAPTPMMGGFGNMFPVGNEYGCNNHVGSNREMGKVNAMYLPQQALPAYGTHQPMYYADGTRVGSGIHTNPDTYNRDYMCSNRVSMDQVERNIYNDFDETRKSEMREHMRRKYRTFSKSNVSKDCIGKGRSMDVSYDSDVEYAGVVELSSSHDQLENSVTTPRKKQKCSTQVPISIDVESKESD